jgi:hypothetical protein
VVRYLAIGGNEDDPRYLKIRIAKEVTLRRNPSPKLKEMLQRYSEVGKGPEVKKFLRNITPIRHSLAGPDPNMALARYALLVFCSCERLEHNIDDWIHITKSALFLRHTMIQRIVQHVLVSSERTPAICKMIQELMEIHGIPHVTSNVRDNIGPRGNPIWQSVYHLLPIDGNARKILFSYSKFELGTL